MKASSSSETEQKADRVRIYLAGMAHTLGCVIIVGWVISHWSEAATKVFGSTGWVPAPLALCFIFLGFRLLTSGSTDKNNCEVRHGEKL